MSWLHLLVEFKMIFSSRIFLLIFDNSISNNFSSIFTSDVHVSERQAQALANYIRANGTSVLRQARSLFLWNNLTNSITVINIKILFKLKFQLYFI